MSVTIAGLLLCSSIPLTAQKGDPPPTASGTHAARTALTDDVILARIHRLNLIQVRAGSLAQQKGTTEEIRRYGAQLVRDHTTFDERVKQYAETHGIALREPRSIPAPDGAKQEGAAANEPALSPPQQGMQTRVSRVLAELPQLEGVEFDNQFLNLTERSHELAVSVLRSTQDQLPDSQLKELIAQLLPMLNNHYVTASRLDLKMDARTKPGQKSQQNSLR